MQSQEFHRPLDFRLRLEQPISALFSSQVVSADPPGLEQILDVPPDRMKPAPLLSLLLVDARQPGEQLADWIDHVLPCAIQNLAKAFS
ncbi:hypothetical protein A7K93_01135 [Candidatus Methylacidiphilum fumarolicum]|uniref:Uncharacterized protein n=2 Tax=Candidatus Methylacidiphilum fumarolicum TaxID=591154 RepID=I0JXT1_METFB|nr:hypothetical protein A7K73_04785 [Candidatus Methylacidiphilum fumarolicum]CCG92050.1 hypothetical protein MFUM_300001 [Methylacidiphilum fumariolicum SolV]TFE73735.1 hypothetical protein A7K72_05380 [Candidatus Methylacidiphilum fumarolicum]TFE75660.1 hypothetical protein A7K93_01135 [Candidatus Methylacidiphilum fumarolicum]TFE76825.1 hypothetical protein A7D33_08560 [Candidatus Methylacidiphilum fumarolicum]